jgi:hypothetical protein
MRAQAGSNLSQFGFEVMASDEFEGDEAEARTEGAAGVEEPEGGGGHRFVEAADPGRPKCWRKGH